MKPYTTKALPPDSSAPVIECETDRLVLRRLEFSDAPFIVKLLNQERDADVIYYDEDKVSEDGATRSAPWFKPGRWSPDLLLSTNYLMHAAIRPSGRNPLQRRPSPSSIRFSSAPVRVS